MLTKCVALLALFGCLIQVQNSESYSAPCPVGEKGDRGFPGRPGYDGFRGMDGEKGDAAPFDEHRIREIIQEVLKGEHETSSETSPEQQPSYGRKGEMGDIGFIGDRGFPGEPGEKGDHGELEEDQVRVFVRDVLNESKVQLTKNENGSGPILFSAKGEKGDKGDIGWNGLDGMSGEEGATGPPGLQGPIGLPGLTGKPGYPGLDGAPGLPGMAGPRGFPGLKGDPGDSAKVDDSHIREVIHDVLSAEGLLKPPTEDKQLDIFGLLELNQTTEFNSLK